MTEFAHTVRDNMPLLDNYSDNVFHEKTVQALQDVYDPLKDSFSRLNKKEHLKEHPDRHDVLEVMRGLLEEDEEFDEMINNLYESAAAMYLLAVQTKVVSSAPFSSVNFLHCSYHMVVNTTRDTFYEKRYGYKKEKILDIDIIIE